jgi:hypothetical protein
LSFENILETWKMISTPSLDSAMFGHFLGSAQVAILEYAYFVLELDSEALHHISRLRLAFNILVRFEQDKRWLSTMCATGFGCLNLQPTWIKSSWHS